MSERTQRRLAAIVSADVVGYSKLMGVDEAGTLAGLRAHRAEMIDGKIAEHSGRIVKTMGDGLLLEFASVVDATQCMVEIQQGMAERNAGIDENRRIVFRIGVNLGDIIIDGDDILGDGVNIAARLQEIAAPGGVAISARVHDDVRDRLDTPFTDGGEQNLKNIARPQQVWRWSPSDAPVKALEVTVTEKPSIAVLCFDNMSSDPDHEFFADGMAEDIITALSKISRMRVIARNSTFAYKGQALDLRKVAIELGVRYVLEGSVRSGGKRLRITSQLIDATDGNHVWAERYDRTIDDIFDIQDEITKEIVTALRVRLTDGEEAAVLARGTTNIQAWQTCIQATELMLKFSSTDYLASRVLAEQAVALDPGYAYAWATLGYTYWWEGRLGYAGDPVAIYAKAAELAERAVALDDTVAWVMGLGALVADAQGRNEQGIALARRGFELYPGNADARGYLAAALVHASQYEEGVAHLRAAMSLNPFYPLWYVNVLSRGLLASGEYDEVLSISDEMLRKAPGHLQAWLSRAYIYAQTDRANDARVAIGQVIHYAPNFRLGHVPGFWTINDPDFMARFLDCLRQTGLPE